MVTNILTGDIGNILLKAVPLPIHDKADFSSLLDGAEAGGTNEQP